MIELLHNLLLVQDVILQSILNNARLGQTLEGIRLGLAILALGRNELDSSKGTHAEGLLRFQITQLVLDEFVGVVIIGAVVGRSITILVYGRRPRCCCATIVISRRRLAIQQILEVAEHEDEVLTHQVQTFDIGTGNASGLTNVLRQERPLAEEVAATEGGDWTIIAAAFSLLEYLHLTAFDEVEHIATLTFANNDVALGKGILLRSEGHGVNIFRLQHIAQDLVANLDLA
mmetsp:Transcript_12167/g.34822  ORF Transcript_12167/g.34822 Transcript_12167/m.34822 type:complete len:231 (-) Transcript_12167:1135-1827(-)